MENFLTGVVVFLILLGILYFAVFIFFLLCVHESAKNRGRNAGGWTLLAIFVTPLLCLPFLSVLGETKEKRKERIVEEELIRKQLRDK